MMLVIGGAHQGQKEFALEKFSQDEVLLDVHELLRGDADENEVLEKALLYACVTCDEVGSGVIPLGRDQREWREKVGHVCQKLAKQAGVVVRMYCGIATALKGEL